MTHTFDHTSPATLGGLARRGLAQLTLLVALVAGLMIPVVALESEASAQSSQETVRKKKVRKKQVRKKQVRRKTKKRVVRKTKVRTTKRRVRTTRRPVTRHRTTVVHHNPPVHSHTTVHHHHHDNRSGGGSVQRTTTRGSSGPSITPYLGVGLGLVGGQGATTSQEANTGIGVQLGVRGRHLGLELGLLGVVDGSPTDNGTNSGGEGSQQLKIGGVSADAKAMLPLGPIEPYLLAGVGLYDLDQDSSDDMDPALNLGLGADIKLTDSIRFGGRYTHHSFWMDSGQPAAVEAEPLESAWSTMGTLSISF